MNAPRQGIALARRATGTARANAVGIVERDPEVVARATSLLRSLDFETNALIDLLDVTGFPANERRKDVALLSTVASGLPPITLDDLIEALRTLATSTGPRALFPNTQAELSLPDEARELLYLLAPLAAIGAAGNRLPRHAGERLRGAALTYTLTQARTRTALAEIEAILTEMARLPLGQPGLTTIRRRRVVRSESTWAADFILVLALLLAVIGVYAVIAVLTQGILPAF